MNLIDVIYKGKKHRLSQRAIELLNLERIEPNAPIEIAKLPPNLEIIKIQKKASETKTITEAEAPKEVLKEALKESTKEVEAPATVVQKKRGCANCGKRKKA